ncbi:MAG: hypothetical protein MZW92_64020 [Comamonadaceae bacterium]|nr:hypothetical protein [Comamonadaceae bacterium]
MIGERIARDARHRRRQRDFLPLLLRQALQLHAWPASCPAPVELVSADLMLLNEADFRAFFEHPRGLLHRRRAVGGESPGSDATSPPSSAPQLPDSRPILREEVLRTYESIFNWREGIVPGAAGGRHPRLRHLRLGEGVGPVGGGEARDRHSQGHRLGNRRRDQDEVLGRRPGLAHGVPASATSPPTCTSSTSSPACSSRC